VETRLRVFVGSSSEQLHIAKAIQANLQPQYEVTVWDQGVFHLSLTTLESLINRLRVTDVAVFVFGPDDVTTLRGRRHKTVRDNVVFELGLFLGALGRKHCFIVVPDGTKDLRIPTDLAGITYGVYAPNRSDRNFRAAVGPVCDQIVQQLGDALSERVDNATIYNSFQSGLIPWDDLFDSTSALDLLFLGSRSWRGHHFQRLERLCAKPKARVRVLLPDPADSGLMASIAAVFNSSIESTIGRVESALTYFAAIAKGMPVGAFTVFGIDRPPLFSFFRFGERALVCFYSHRQRLIGVPTVLCSSQDHTFRLVAEEFDYLLQNAHAGNKKLV
jgi:Predicted nucleotide-binding protein containing TIR-like domain